MPIIDPDAARCRGSLRLTDQDGGIPRNHESPHDIHAAKNAHILDGTGAPGFWGHVLVQDDRIAHVIPREDAPLPQADAVLDVAGHCLAPGFIDMHSHTDWQLPDPDHHELLYQLLEQGVTTVVGGNCGISAAPVRPETVSRLEKLATIAMDRPLGYGWRSIGELLHHLEEVVPLVNVAEIVGHASVQYAATDVVRGGMSSHDLGCCERVLRQAFDEGACGLSYGLGYDPGMFAPAEELEAFARVAARAGRPITVHIKALARVSPAYPATTPRAHNVLALQQCLELARRSGASLQISHLMFAGRRSWSTAEQCLSLVDEARHQGLDVAFDAFPYTCGNTTIDVVLPHWFLAQLPSAYGSRLKRLALNVELTAGFLLLGFGYADFQLMDVTVPGWEWANGLRISEVARKWQVSGLDALLRISERSRGGALMLYHRFSGEPGQEASLEAVLSHQACLFETDAVHRRVGYPNPAGRGTFPRILGEYCRRRGLFSLEDAVHRMTAASAQRFGLRDRGQIRAGLAADLVVFDAGRVDDALSLGAPPDQAPQGIHHVFVNGFHVVRDGRYLGGQRHGKVLRV